MRWAAPLPLQPHALVAVLLANGCSCAGQRPSEPTVAIDRGPGDAMVPPGADMADAPLSTAEAGAPPVADAAPPEAAPADAGALPETIDHWLARHGVTAPSDPRSDTCVPPNPCPADCVRTWTIAPSLDAIQCNQTASVAALARSDIVDHRRLSNAVVYVATSGKLLPVLTVPISDVDIEFTWVNVRVALQPSTDGLSVDVADESQKCSMVPGRLLGLDRAVFLPRYRSAVAERLAKVCGALGSYRWDGKRYQRAAATARTQ